MNNSNTGQQLRYLEEVRSSLHRVGFETKPPEDCQLPILWNDAPLCRITGKGSVFYRREDVDTPQAEDALFRIEDIAAKTLEYMTAMESAPQLKAAGWMKTTVSSLTLAARCWQALRANTAFNSSHGIGTMTAQAWYTGTISWRTTMVPSRISPHALGLSKRNSFSAQNS